MVECPECGEMFEPTKKQVWQIKNRPQHRIFCSMACSIKARDVIVKGGQKRKKCACCGTIFKLSVNQRRKVALNVRARVGCSPECTNKIKSTPIPKVEPPKKAIPTVKPKISPWIPYCGVGGEDFHALVNPF